MKAIKRSFLCSGPAKAAEEGCEQTGPKAHCGECPADNGAMRGAELPDRLLDGSRIRNYVRQHLIDCSEG